MRLYGGTHFYNYAEQQKEEISNQINSQSDTYLLNVNVDDYTAHLVSEHELNIPAFNINDVFADPVERDIPGSRFPPHAFNVDSNETYRKNVIRYHIPYTGDVDLLELTPNPRKLISYDVDVDRRQKCFIIEIIDFYNNAERIKQEYARELEYLISNYDNLSTNLQEFNDDLKIFIRSKVNERKQKILDKNNLVASLGVPIRKRQNVAESFAVPSPKLKEKIIISKPFVNDAGFKPEPALDSNNYHKILKYINDVGKNLERQPSTYKGKGEEDIRDFIILVLDPNFEMGSAGGETFNKSGKTDISLRYDSNVVFVAECKYWKGEKVYLKTIDQLLGYLTWRDSKVAVINFVQNNEFTDVLHKIKSSTRTHSNFLEELTQSDENWFNYKFHLNGDRNRMLDLAVISYHLPK